MMKKKLTYLLSLLLLFIVSSCSDEEFNTSRSPGSLETEDGVRISVLHIDARNIEKWKEARDVSFRIENPSSRKSYSFDGTIAHSPDVEVFEGRGALTCRIRIGDTDIPDGRYYLVAESEDMPGIGIRTIEFSGNKGVEVKSEPMSYDDLSGAGTESDPYLINDDGDFLTLLWYLEQDPDHAYGRYFRQTASFDVPRRSQIIDGHVWAPVQFSGTYDGGGNELRNLTYQGSSDAEADSDIGLFKEIYSGTIKNLTLSRVMIINAVNNVGILAGRTGGNVRFENITLEGTVSASGICVGGMIGFFEGGEATIRNVALKSLSVSATSSHSLYTGLLIGRFNNVSLDIDGVTTPDHIFAVTGHDCVGGLVGYAYGDIKMRNITLEHSVDAESSNVKVVYGSGDRVGGLAGEMIGLTNIDISGVTVKAPVRGGGTDTGGLAGYAMPTHMTISNVLLASVVNGVESVGGFFGYLGFENIFRGDLSIDASSKPVRYVVKSSADAEVKGETNVGGVVGYLDTTDGDLKVKGAVEVAVNVRGRDNVGGAIGYAIALDNLNPYWFNFSSTTMRVTADGDNAGGVIGYLETGTIDGGLRLNPVNNVPDKASYKSCFSGVVTALGNAGGVVGCSGGKITGVSSSASVTSTGKDAGGICAVVRQNVNNSAFTGTVDAKLTAGGIVGICVHDLYMHDCINYGVVRATSDNAGGVCGYVRGEDGDNLNITRCFNSGNISGPCVGGVVGYASNANTGKVKDRFEITECGNVGRIEGTGYDKPIGGVVGDFVHRKGTVARCANGGEVYSGSSQYAIGGVVGNFGENKFADHNFGKLTECMNRGKVYSTYSDNRVGGVLGNLARGDISYNSELTDCYNIGEIPSDQHRDTGGILAFAGEYTNIYRTFNRGKVSYGNAIIGDHQGSTLFHHKYNYFLKGTGKSWPSSTEVSESNLGNKSSYQDFDFTNIWDITSDGPVLRRCPFQK